MSFDQRLRDELAREAAHLDVDVERQLGSVEARAARRRSVGGPTLVLAAAIVVAALILRTGPLPATTDPGSAGSSPSGPGPRASATAGNGASILPGPAASPGASSPSFPEIAGTFEVALDPQDPAVARDQLGGTWTMRLQADGEVFMSAPASFVPGTSGLSGIAFSLAGDRFRTNLFINDNCGTVGTYTWARAGGRLSLTALTDDCAIRRTLLASRPWTELP